MSIHETDLRDAEFMQRLRARDFAGAHESLDRMAARHSMRAASHAAWKAHIHQFEGRVADAVELLATFIEADDIDGKFLRHQRARLYASAGMLDEALTDFRTVAADETPRIVEALRNGAYFEIAYILALRADPEFESVCSRIPETREQFVAGALLSKADLRSLFRANQKRTAAGAPAGGRGPRDR